MKFLDWLLDDYPCRKCGEYEKTLYNGICIACELGVYDDKHKQTSQEQDG